MPVWAVYGDCQECRLIFEGWEPLAVPREPCPCPSCGSLMGLPWPPWSAEGLLDKAFESVANGPEDEGVSVTLVASALEIMLESDVAALLEREGASSLLMDWLIENQWTVDSRIELLRKVGGVSIKSVARSVGCPLFPEQWKRLREERNSFVHRGEASYEEATTRAWLQEVAVAGVRVLAETNNALWRREV